MPFSVAEKPLIKDGPRPDMIERGARLRHAREDAGLTQAEAAEKLIGYRRGSVTAWEAGHVDPNPHVVVQLARAYGTTPEWLMFGVTFVNGTRKVKAR